MSGSLWTDSEAHADTVLEEIITALFGSGASRPTRISTTDHKERWGTNTTTTTAGSAWSQLDFQLGKTTKMTGAVGFDIREASYTLERTGCLNHTVVTHIPFGRPNAQVGTGHLAGKVTISATCKAVSAATARDWVQGKRSMVSGIGTSGVTRHETEQPRESCTPEHTPFSGSEVTTWSFTGSYGWTFTGTVLDGLWGSGFGGI